VDFVHVGQQGLWGGQDGRAQAALYSERLTTLRLMAEPLALLDEGLVAHVAPVGLHHDVGGRVLGQVGLGGEEPSTQLARQLWRGLLGNLDLGVAPLVLGDHMRLESRHGLKGPVADVAVMTFTLVHGLDVQLEAVLQGVGRATFLAAKLWLLGRVSQPLMPLYIEMSVGLVGAVRTGEYRGRGWALAILAATCRVSGVSLHIAMVTAPR